MSLSFSQIKPNHFNLSKVKSIEKNRLITFVNHFIASVISQCNELICVIDSRLNCINRQLNICQANLVILETRLNSIPSLGSVSTQLSSNSAQRKELPSSNRAETQERSDQELDQSQMETKEDKVASEKVKSTESREEGDEETKTEDKIVVDERLVKYQKMLHFGVPLHAVQHKMKADGMDQELINSFDKLQ
jgi:PREDICTED: similar to GA20344-PA